MQILILTNNKKIEVEKIMGETIYIEGIPRESLSFYPADKDFNRAMELFTEENCKKLTIVDGENKFLHEGYQIRNYVKLEGENLIVNMIKLSNSDLEINKLKEKTEEIEMLKKAIVELTALVSLERSSE